MSSASGVSKEHNMRVASLELKLLHPDAHGNDNEHLAFCKSGWSKEALNAVPIRNSMHSLHNMMLMKSRNGEQARGIPSSM